MSLVKFRTRHAVSLRSLFAVLLIFIAVDTHAQDWFERPNGLQWIAFGSGIAAGAVIEVAAFSMYNFEKSDHTNTERMIILLPTVVIGMASSMASTLWFYQTTGNQDRSESVFLGAAKGALAASASTLVTLSWTGIMTDIIDNAFDYEGSIVIPIFLSMAAILPGAIAGGIAGLLISVALY